LLDLIFESQCECIGESFFDCLQIGQTSEFFIYKLFVHSGEIVDNNERIGKRFRGNWFVLFLYK
jgi:hypothetical protein